MLVLEMFMLMPAMLHKKPATTNPMGISLSKGEKWPAVMPIINVLIPAAMAISKNFT